jgi:hypothetical protein
MREVWFLRITHHASFKVFYEQYLSNLRFGCVNDILTVAPRVDNG